MGRAWTAREVALLRGAIEEHSIEWIAGQVGRTRGGVWQRASDMGLLAACRQGRESESAAAARCGVSQALLRRILAWAGVHGQRGKSLRREKQRRAYVAHYYEPEDVDAAMAKWQRTEMLTPACGRLGACPLMMRKHLRAIGVEPTPTMGRLVRLESDVYDHAVAAARETRRRGETVLRAARRVGISRNVLARELAAAGVRRRSRAHEALDPATVDAVVARYRARRAAESRWPRGTESIVAAAARTRTDYCTLRRWLRAVGVVPRQGFRTNLDPALVDRVVAQHRPAHRRAA